MKKSLHLWSSWFWQYIL